MTPSRCASMNSPRSVFDGGGAGFPPTMSFAGTLADRTVRAAEQRRCRTLAAATRRRRAPCPEMCFLFGRTDGQFVTDGLGLVTQVHRDAGRVPGRQSLPLLRVFSAHFAPPLTNVFLGGRCGHRRNPRRDAFARAQIAVAGRLLPPATGAPGCSISRSPFDSGSAAARRRAQPGRVMGVHHAAVWATSTTTTEALHLHAPANLRGALATTSRWSRRKTHS